nr:MAG TPA: hypothetical protein [Caudoviricetes sp.]
MVVTWLIPLVIFCLLVFSVRIFPSLSFTLVANHVTSSVFTNKGQKVFVPRPILGSRGPQAFPYAGRTRGPCARTIKKDGLSAVLYHCVPHAAGAST